MNLARARTSRDQGQDKDHAGFVARDEPYDCGQCVLAHAEGRARGMPPGATFPPLDDDSVLAWRIYQEVQGQVIVGMDIIGLDFTCLPTVFDFYRVPEAERLALFRKVAVIDEAHREHRAVVRASESSRKAEATTQAAAVSRG